MSFAICRALSALSFRFDLHSNIKFQEVLMVTISFPGLGIGNFNINSVAFNLFGKFEVRWYGLIITTGIILAIAYAAFRFKREKILFDDLLDMAIFAIIFGIIGARAYYVLTSLDEYHSLYDVIAIWNGGIAIYGALIGGGLAIFFVCKHKKISFFKVADAVAPGVMIAQTLGRWGNFCNGEAFGARVAEGHPLYFARMGLISANSVADFKTFAMVYVHPTFLYESLWNLIGFILINIFYKKKKFDGQIFFTYIAWYGFGRMFIELLRTDSLYVGPIRISSLVGLICFIVGAATIIYKLIKIKKNGASCEAIEACCEAAEVEETIDQPEFVDVSSKLGDLISDTPEKENEEN